VFRAPSDFINRDDHSRRPVEIGESTNDVPIVNSSQRNFPSVCTRRTCWFPLLLALTSNRSISCRSVPLEGGHPDRDGKSASRSLIYNYQSGFLSLFRNAARFVIVILIFPFLCEVIRSCELTLSVELYELSEEINNAHQSQALPCLNGKS